MRQHRIVTSAITSATTVEARGMNIIMSFNTEYD